MGAPTNAERFNLIRMITSVTEIDIFTAADLLIAGVGLMVALAAIVLTVVEFRNARQEAARHSDRAIRADYHALLELYGQMTSKDALVARQTHASGSPSKTPMEFQYLRALLYTVKAKHNAFLRALRADLAVVEPQAQSKDAERFEASTTSDLDWPLLVSKITEEIEAIRRLPGLEDDAISALDSISRSSDHSKYQWRDEQALLGKHGAIQRVAQHLAADNPSMGRKELAELLRTTFRVPLPLERWKDANMFLRVDSDDDAIRVVKSPICSFALAGEPGHWVVRHTLGYSTPQGSNYADAIQLPAIAALMTQYPHLKRVR